MKHRARTLLICASVLFAASIAAVAAFPGFFFDSWTIEVKQGRGDLPYTLSVVVPIPTPGDAVTEHSVSDLLVEVNAVPGLERKAQEVFPKLKGVVTVNGVETDIVFESSPDSNSLRSHLQFDLDLGQASVEVSIVDLATGKTVLKVGAVKQ